MMAVGYIITRSAIYAAAIALVDTVTKLVVCRLEKRPASPDPHQRAAN